MDFVASVSHDLRTPLAAIRGAAFSIGSGLVKQPEALDRYGALILRNAEDLSAMVENLLAFASSRKKHGNLLDRSENVDVQLLIQRAAASIEHVIEASGSQLEINVADGTPAVKGDPMAIERALRNLLDNAVRHGAGSQWNGITAEREESMVVIRVRDRGPGIAAGALHRVFEPFYSGEASRLNMIRGTGPGLSWSKKHWMRTAAESTPDIRLWAERNSW